MEVTNFQLVFFLHLLLLVCNQSLLRFFLQLSNIVGLTPQGTSESSSSYFWLIAPPEGPSSYLFGTIHVPYSKLVDTIPDNVKEALEVNSRKHVWIAISRYCIEFPLFYSKVTVMVGWNWILETQLIQNTDITSTTLEDLPKSLCLTTNSHPSSNPGIKACTRSNSM